MNKYVEKVWIFLVDCDITVTHTIYYTGSKLWQKNKLQTLADVVIIVSKGYGNTKPNIVLFCQFLFSNFFFKLAD